MAVSLTKGGNVSLSKQAPGLTRILVGLGWDARATDGGAFDLDASAFLLGPDGKVAGSSDFVFYNNLKDASGSVQHQGDNQTGAGDGDDESLLVDLSKVPPSIQKIAITVTIHEADIRRQNFGMVSNAFVRIVNLADNQEITRFDLGEEASTETAMIFAEVYKNGNEWKFKAIGQGFAGGLGTLARNFGIQMG